MWTPSSARPKRSRFFEARNLLVRSARSPKGDHFTSSSEYDQRAIPADRIENIARLDVPSRIVDENPAVSRLDGHFIENHQTTVNVLSFLNEDSLNLAARLGECKSGAHCVVLKT